MQLSRLAFLVVAASITHNAWTRGREIDFESDLISWPLLKRYAGYRTEGGRYRGGLYKSARHEEHEYYVCQLNTTDHCTSWTMKERGGASAEDGACFCEETETPYCAHWSCPHLHVGYDAACDDSGCIDVWSRQTIDCSCDETDRNGRYCMEWSCIEGTVHWGEEYELYTCIEEDASGEYCFRWKGDISSSYELESAVCECVTRTETFCDYWECKERGIVRCAAHAAGWCDLNIAIGVGGGLGVLFTFVGCLCASSFDTCKERVACLSITFLILCMPWSLGVVVWGGVRAIPIVAAMWTFSWFVVISAFAYKHNYACKASCHEARTVHPTL